MRQCRPLFPPATHELRVELCALQHQELIGALADDGPAKTFVARVAMLKANPPAADWNGVWGVETR